MARKKRKVGFYYLTSINAEVSVFDSFNETIAFIDNLSRAERRLSLTNEKFCLLDSRQAFQNNVRQRIIIKSATHSFRPNLIHRETIDERESPKQIEEGEVEKTHIMTKLIEGELVLILEKHMDGVPVSQFVKYLNYFSSLMDREGQVIFGYEIIVKEDFLAEINSLTRITCADIHVDKQLLGSNSLDYSNRISQVKHEIVVSVKANTRDSIADFARDIFAKINGGDTTIRKIRITGRNDDNNVVVINTDFIERQEYINPTIDLVTGEFLTGQIFDEMETILHNFN